MYWILLLLALGGYTYWVWPKPVPVVHYEQFYGLGTPTVPETEENTRLKRVQETTPEGEVLMWREDGMFKYHSARPVQYKYLETVARKYCIVYDCRGDYINIFRELLKNLPVQEEKLDDVFVDFKPYNKRKKAITKDQCNCYKWMGAVEKPAERLLSYAEFKKLS